MGLDASTLSDAEPIATGRLSQEGLDSRRLPDAGLAGDEDDLTVPVRGPRQAPTQLPHLLVTANDQRGRPRSRTHRRKRIAGQALRG